MSRRADPARIFLAQRMAVRNTMVDEQRVPLETADAWCDAWEAEAARLNHDRGWSDYWTVGSVWIREQRAARKLPE